MAFRNAGTWGIVTVLFVLLALAVAFSVIGWQTAGVGPAQVSNSGFIAMALGVIATLALGIGLMAVMFHGNRRGH